MSAHNLSQALRAFVTEIENKNSKRLFSSKGKIRLNLSVRIAAYAVRESPDLRLFLGKAQSARDDDQSPFDALASNRTGTVDNGTARSDRTLPLHPSRQSRHLGRYTKKPDRLASDIAAATLL